MRRDEVIKRLRELREMKAAVERMEDALEMLTEEERDILETIYIDKVRYGADILCEKLVVERACVYKRARKAVQKLEGLLR